MHLFGPQKTVKVPNGHLKGRCVSFILTLSTPNFKVTQNTQSAGGEPHGRSTAPVVRMTRSILPRFALPHREDRPKAVSIGCRWERHRTKINTKEGHERSVCVRLQSNKWDCAREQYHHDAPAVAHPGPGSGVCSRVWAVWGVFTCNRD